LPEYLHSTDREGADSALCARPLSKAIEKDYMITVTTVSPLPIRAAIAMSLGAAAIGAVGLGLLAAPTAAASPAPSSIEADYIDTLDANGMHIVGQDADELKLGYLLCALSQQNELPPADAAAYMNAARTSKLCYYVSSNGGPTGAQVQQGTDAWQQQQNAPGIDAWNDTDQDNDGHDNSDDYDDYDPGTY
jgi:hypothetical protein